MVILVGEVGALGVVAVDSGAKALRCLFCKGVLQTVGDIGNSSGLQSLGRIYQGKAAAELGGMKKKYAEMGWGTAGEMSWWLFNTTPQPPLKALYERVSVSGRS